MRKNGINETEPVLAVPVNRSGTDGSARSELDVSLGSAERLLPPYSPASTIAPNLTAWTEALSGVRSSVRVGDTDMVTTSPDTQFRSRVRNVFGVAAMFCSTPLILTWVPVRAQDGTRIFSAMCPEPPVTVSRVLGWSGNAVSWRMVMPRWVQFSTEGMKRLTYNVESAKKKMLSANLVWLSIPVPWSQVKLL